MRHSPPMIDSKLRLKVSTTEKLVEETGFRKPENKTWWTESLATPFASQAMRLHHKIDNFQQSQNLLLENFESNSNLMMPYILLSTTLLWSSSATHMCPIVPAGALCPQGCWHECGLIHGDGSCSCVPSGVGQHSPRNDNCKYLCGMGTYSNIDGTELCSSCPAGTHASTAGGTVIPFPSTSGLAAFVSISLWASWYWSPSSLV